MTVPTVYPTGLLTGRFVDLAGDPMTGQVNITAATIARSIALVGSGLVVWGGTVSFTLDADGRLPAGLYLPATDTDQTNPTGFTYRVSLSWRAQDFHIQVPAGSTQDLADIMPVAESAGVITVPAEPRPATEVTSTQLAEAIAANAESTAAAISGINISTGDLQLDLDLSSTNALIEATNAALADPLHVIVDSGASAGGLTDDELRAAPVVVHLDQAIDVQSDALTDDELRAAPLHVITDNLPDLAGLATDEGLAAILARLVAGLGVTVTNPTAATDVSALATQATLAAVLAKLSGDPATQTTLAAVLALLTAGIKTTEQAPLNIAGLATTARQDVTHADLAAVLAKLGTTLTTDVGDRAGRLLGHVTVDNPTAATDVSALATQATVEAVRVLLAAGIKTTEQAPIAGFSTAAQQNANGTQAHTDAQAVINALAGVLAVSLSATDRAKLDAAAPLAADSAALVAIREALGGGNGETSNVTLLASILAKLNGTLATSGAVAGVTTGVLKTTGDTLVLPVTGLSDIYRVGPVKPAAMPTGNLTYLLETSSDGGNTWNPQASQQGDNSTGLLTGHYLGGDLVSRTDPVNASITAVGTGAWFGSGLISRAAVGITNARIRVVLGTLSVGITFKVLSTVDNPTTLAAPALVNIANSSIATSTTLAASGQSVGIVNVGRSINSETAVALAANATFNGSSRSAASGSNIPNQYFTVQINSDQPGTAVIQHSNDGGVTWLNATPVTAYSADTTAGGLTLSVRCTRASYRVQQINGPTLQGRNLVTSAVTGI